MTLQTDDRLTSLVILARGDERNEFQILSDVYLFIPEGGGTWQFWKENFRTKKKNNNKAKMKFLSLSFREEKNPKHFGVLSCPAFH